MPIMAQSAHRPSALKQENKRHHKLGHKTKGQIKSLCQGRLSLQSISRKAKHELNKKERRNQVKVIRSEKRTKVMNQKRKLGTDAQPPFLACVVMLSSDINPRSVMSALTGADTAAIITCSRAGNTHISCTRFKQRYTFVVPPIDDMYAILDTAKVCSTLLVVWPCCDRDEEMLGADQQRLLSCIKAQGLPTPVHVTLGYQDMAHKRKTAALRNLLLEVRHYFPGDEKAHVHELDKPMDALMCLRQVGAQKQRPLFYRDHRPHLLADDLHYQDDVDSASTGTLMVSGYLRGVPLSANSLVHIPGWGDYQLSKIVQQGSDPHPLVLNLNARDREMVAEQTYIMEADPQQQETTASTREVVSDSESDNSGDEENDDMDAPDDGSDVSRSVKSLTTVPVKKRKIPGAYSAYQAAWMVDNDAYDNDSDSEYDDGDDDDEPDEFEPPEAADDEASFCGDDDNDDSMSVTSGSEIGMEDDTYDEKVDYDDEMGEYERIRACREDLEFPDEIDTPRDVLTRERFHKYRGLESFKTSTWDITENLPNDYKKIFHIPKFNLYRKKVLALEQEDDASVAGQYVTLHIKNVEKHLYQDHVKSRSPLVVFGLLHHEQKMAVVNLVLKSHPIGHTRPIKSKDRLFFHVGFRRFANQPIFSEHTAGDKQKFCRYFHPGETVVASVYAPITYPPASVLVFRQLSGGRQELVATGSVYSVDANRCILKRQILSGHPFKIHKRSAVIRYMFFDRDDIIWFKPIELKTKWGRKGKIKEALGTHGHMKCQFNRQLKSQDTIMLNLYKRVYPKWNYNPCVARPCPMYSAEIFDHDSDEEDDSNEDEVKKIQERKDRALMPPPSKKPKKVHFN